MSAKYIFSSEVIVDTDRAEIAWDLWKNMDLVNLPENSVRQTYRAEEEPNRFLELIAFSDLTDINMLIQFKQGFPNSLSQFMQSDWHQQVFEHIETVRDGETLLPSSDKIQLRYIEVPLSVHKEYLQWRQETIFDVIKSSKNIDSFVAYHTVFSTQPGVMFFSGFSIDTHHYLKDNFKTERYQDIVRQAGSNFIAGGENGLYTRVYVKD